MDVKQSFVDVEEEIPNDGSADQPRSQSSLTDDLNSQNKPDDATVHLTRTESLTEVTILSEQMPYEDSEPSLTDISANERYYQIPSHDTFPNMTKGLSHADIPVTSEFHQNNSLNKPRGEMIRALPVYGPWYLEKDQPQPLSALLPPSKGHCSVYEMSQSHISSSRSQHSLPTNTVQTQLSNGDDLCASILWACLFCQPLDCLLATGRGCGACVSHVCYFLCGCEPATLEPALDVAPQCDCCGCVDACCCLCDCPVCDICMQATECLDLAMEISQMLYH